MTSGGYTTTLAGGLLGYKDNSAPNLVEFRFIEGIAVDKAGYAYVADSQAAQIRRIAPNGTSGTVAGTAMTSGSNDGLGSTALFVTPRAITVSKGGQVIVSDFFRLRKIQRIISN